MTDREAPARRAPRHRRASRRAGRGWWALLAAGLAAAGGAGLADGDRPPASGRTFTLRPIGTVLKEQGRTFIVLDEKYVDGLLGVDELTHVTVLYWFDRNDTPARRSILRVHPRGDPSNPLRGVFATRAPVRPNLIALSRCRIVAVRHNVIEVDAIDAFPGSPVLDLKP
jgi:tRNA-Thr(GGU) m(6)t(6)A37 methyltransferase TsaA